MSLVETIASRIKFFRKSRSIIQRTLAEKMNLSLRHFQKIESAAVDIKASTLESLAKQFAVPACYLARNPQMGESTHGLPCLVEILDLLHVGIQINDKAGRVLYANHTHLDMHGLSPADLDKGFYIWDFLFDSNEKSSLQSTLSELVKNQPAPTTYFAKNRTKTGDLLPVKVEWRYIFDEPKQIRYFLSVITYHPSW